MAEASGPTGGRRVGRRLGKRKARRGPKPAGDVLDMVPEFEALVIFSPRASRLLRDAQQSRPRLRRAARVSKDAQQRLDVEEVTGSKPAADESSPPLPPPRLKPRKLRRSHHVDSSAALGREGTEADPRERSTLLSRNHPPPLPASSAPPRPSKSPKLRRQSRVTDDSCEQQRERAGPSESPHVSAPSAPPRPSKSPRLRRQSRVTDDSSEQPREGAETASNEPPHMSAPSVRPTLPSRTHPPPLPASSAPPRPSKSPKLRRQSRVTDDSSEQQRMGSAKPAILPPPLQEEPKPDIPTQKFLKSPILQGLFQMCTQSAGSPKDVKGRKDSPVPKEAQIPTKESNAEADEEGESQNMEEEMTEIKPLSSRALRRLVAEGRLQIAARTRPPLQRGRAFVMEKATEVAKYIGAETAASGEKTQVVEEEDNDDEEEMEIKRGIKLPSQRISASKKDSSRPGERLRQDVDQQRSRTERRDVKEREAERVGGSARTRPSLERTRAAELDESSARTRASSTVIRPLYAEEEGPGSDYGGARPKSTRTRASSTIIGPLFTGDEPTAGQEGASLKTDSLSDRVALSGEKLSFDAEEMEVKMPFRPRLGSRSSVDSTTTSTSSRTSRRPLSEDWLRRIRSRSLDGAGSSTDTAHTECEFNMADKEKPSPPRGSGTTTKHEEDLAKTKEEHGGAKSKTSGSRRTSINSESKSDIPKTQSKEKQGAPRSYQPSSQSSLSSLPPLPNQLPRPLRQTDDRHRRTEMANRYRRVRSEGALNKPGPSAEAEGAAVSSQQRPSLVAESVTRPRRPRLSNPSLRKPEKIAPGPGESQPSNAGPSRENRRTLSRSCSSPIMQRPSEHGSLAEELLPAIGQLRLSQPGQSDRRRQPRRLSPLQRPSLLPISATQHHRRGRRCLPTEMIRSDNVLRPLAPNTVSRAPVIHTIRKARTHTGEGRSETLPGKYAEEEPELPNPIGTTLVLPTEWNTRDDQSRPAMTDAIRRPTCRTRTGEGRSETLPSNAEEEPDQANLTSAIHPILLAKWNLKGTRSGDVGRDETDSGATTSRGLKRRCTVESLEPEKKKRRKLTGEKKQTADRDYVLSSERLFKARTSYISRRGVLLWPRKNNFDRRGKQKRRTRSTCTIKKRARKLFKSVEAATRTRTSSRVAGRRLPKYQETTLIQGCSGVTTKKKSIPSKQPDQQQSCQPNQASSRKFVFSSMPMKTDEVTTYKGKGKQRKK